MPFDAAGTTGNELSVSPQPGLGTAQYPVQASIAAVMAGVPQANLAAVLSQAPPGEPGYTEPAHDLQDMLPTLKSAYLELVNAREAYSRAEKYSNGISPEVFSDPQLRRLLGLSEDSYALNYADIPIRVMNNRINIASITVPGDPDSTAALQDLWKANKMGLAENSFTYETLKYGDGYLIIWPTMTRAGMKIQIEPNSPVTTRVFYSPESPRQPIFAIKSWEDNKLIRVDLYFPDWVYKFVSVNMGRTWIEYDDGSGAWPMCNPFGVVPVFHFKAGNSHPYGTPVHAAAYGPSDGLIKSANTLFSTLEFYGFPQRYALVDITSAEGTSQFSDFDRDQPDAFITDDQGRTSGLRQGPGELWALAAKSVGQFTPAAVDNFLNTWSKCIEAMALCTETPMHYFAEAAGQHPSGDAIRAADSPLRAKVKNQQLSFAAAWEEALTFALALSGVIADDVQVTWQPSEAVDDQQGMMAAVWQARTGVPIVEIYRSLGYSEETIDSWDLPPEAYKAATPELWAGAAAIVAPGEVTAQNDTGPSDPMLSDGSDMPTPPEAPMPPGMMSKTSA